MGKWEQGYKTQPETIINDYCFVQPKPEGSTTHFINVKDKLQEWQDWGHIMEGGGDQYAFVKVMFLLRE